MGVCRVLDLRLEERFRIEFGLEPDPRQVDEWICFVSINLDFLFTMSCMDLVISHVFP